MDKKIKLALKAEHMDNNILIKPAIVSPMNPWSSMHWHDFYELEIILSGEGQVICNNKIYSTKPGMISFLTPSDMHKYIVDTDFETLCIQFTEDSISKEVLESLLTVENNVIFLDDEELKNVISLCHLLDSDMAKKLSGDLYKTKLLEALLILLKNKFGTTSTAYKTSPQVMQKALSYIHSHFKENPKMSDVAKLLYLNEHYFSYLFKENVGECYKDYLRKLKLDYARKLVLHTSLSLTQIAYECGYSSQSNFNRDFKKVFEVSPKCMRQENI